MIVSILSKNGLGGRLNIIEKLENFGQFSKMRCR